MPDPWYPLADEYFVPPDEANQYPVRQGDVFPLPDSVAADAFRGSMVIHPSCEIQTGKAERPQVALLRAVADLPDPNQQVALTYGEEEKGGQMRIAYAHTFWLPPAADVGPLSEPLFADFREVERVELDFLTVKSRVQAMTHDARVHLIRRKVYYTYRWKLPLNQVRQLEANRISADPAFSGPRPSWAE